MKDDTWGGPELFRLMTQRENIWGGRCTISEGEGKGTVLVRWSLGRREDRKYQASRILVGIVWEGKVSNLTKKGGVTKMDGKGTDPT